MTLETLLQDKGIPFELHQHPAAYTAQGLAHEEHVTGYMVAKPVIVRTASGFAMCVVPAPAHVSLPRVADVLGEKDVHLATESEMADLFPDCELGAEPPVGKLFGLKTIVDPQLQQDEELVMQAGSHTRAIKMRREDWERVAEPIVAAITTG